MRQNAKKVLIAAPALLLLTGCDEKIVNAGYNTLLGMGMAFTVLIIISLVISVLSVMSRAPEAKKKDDKDLRLKAVDNAVKQIEKQEQAAVQAPAAAGSGGQDGGFMIAIFAAAIAAYEAEHGTGTSPVITGVTPLAGNRGIAPQPLPDLTGYEGVYVRPLYKQLAVHWKRA